MADKRIIREEGEPASEPKKKDCGCKGLVLTATAGTGAVVIPPCPNDGVARNLQCLNGKVDWAPA